MGIVFQVAAEIRSEVSTAAKVGNGSARASAADADVMGDVGVGADGVDHYGLDNVFAGVTVDVESEFIIGAAPLTEIDRVTGGDVEDLEIFRRVVAIWSGSGLWCGRLAFGGGDVG